MFLLTFLVVNMADTKRKLENDVFAAAGIAQKNNCALTRLDYQQETGLMSSVPLGENLIPIQRGLTTSSTAIFIPFITQELFQTGAALYYGLNALSNNMILCDRKQLKNPNGLILGTPGSGKSFAAKREMTNAFLITDDDIIICDPEAEYFSLVQRLDGQVIRLSPTGKGIDGKPQYVNPMDINLNYSEDDSPLALKSDFILSLCELVIGGKEGLQPVDKTVIDRAVRNVYRPFLADPAPEKMPILGDLYNELLKQPEPEAARIAAALELYVSGSLNVFNHRTNVELSNRLVCFDIKQLGKQLKKVRYAHCAGPGMEPRHRQPGRKEIHPVFYGRISSSLERGTDRRLFRGNLEAFQKMGRHTHSHYAERQRPFGKPARWRTSLKTLILSSCSIRRRATGLSLRSSSTSPRSR